MRVIALIVEDEQEEVRLSDHQPPRCLVWRALARGSESSRASNSQGLARSFSGVLWCRASFKLNCLRLPSLTLASSARARICPTERLIFDPPFVKTACTACTNLEVPT